MFSKQVDKQREMTAEQWADKARELHRLKMFNDREDRIAYSHFCATMAVYEKLCEMEQKGAIR